VPGFVEAPGHYPAREGGAYHFGESAGEVAPAHPGVGREVVNGEWLVEAGQCPVDGRTQVTHPAGLGHRAVDALCLVALAVRCDNEIARDGRGGGRP
jgi:hypothetical protein